MEIAEGQKSEEIGGKEMGEKEKEIGLICKM